jgi:hypothetical protein
MPLKIGDKVKATGEGLKANPHYKDVEGVVYRETTSGNFWVVQWRPGGHTSIWAENELELILGKGQ